MGCRTDGRVLSLPALFPSPPSLRVSLEVAWTVLLQLGEEPGSPAHPGGGLPFPKRTAHREDGCRSSGLSPLSVCPELQDAAVLASPIPFTSRKRVGFSSCRSSVAGLSRAGYVGGSRAGSSLSTYSQSRGLDLHSDPSASTFLLTVRSRFSSTGTLRSSRRGLANSTIRALLLDERPYVFFLCSSLAVGSAPC